MMSADSVKLRTVEQYVAAKSELACLVKQLEDAGESLVSLGNALKERPESVTLLDQYVSIVADSVSVSIGDAHLRSSVRIANSEFSAENIRALLRQYQEVRTKKSELERELRQIGLGALTD